MKCKEHYSKASARIKTYAKCVDDTRRPSFPKTGSIWWKGTVVYDRRHWGERQKLGPLAQTAYIHGRAWKDDGGNFYREESQVEKFPGKGTDHNREPPVMKDYFEMIVPDGTGKYTRYDY